MVFPTFEVKVSNQVLRPTVSAADQITDEAVYEVSEKVLKTEVVDAGQNTYAETVTELGAEEEVNVEMPGQFGVSTASLSSALNDLSKRQDVILSGEAVSAEIEVVDPQSGDVVSSLGMKDPEELRDTPEPPQINWDAEVEMNGGDFREVHLAAKKVSNNLTLGVADNPERGETGKALLAYADGDTDDIGFYPDFEFTGIGSPPGDVGAIYSLDLLGDLRNSIDKPSSTALRLRFSGVEFPVEASFSIGPESETSVRYIVSPRLKQTDWELTDDLGAIDPSSYGFSEVGFRLGTDGEHGRALFDLMGMYADEYRIIARETGIESASIDPANVGLISTQADPSYFDIYEEVAGFPQQQVGIASRNIEELLKRFNKRDDFELAVSSNRRYVALQHPLFTARLATIDPDAIRADPSLPDLELTSEAQVPSDELVNTLSPMVGKDRVAGYIVGNGEAWLVADAFSGGSASQLQTSSVNGRAFTALSGEYLGKMIDAIPGIPGGSVRMRAGVELPVAFEYQTGGGDLTAVSTIAPRQITDDFPEKIRDMKEAIPNGRDVLNWIDPANPDDWDNPDFSVSAFSGAKIEPLSERVRAERLQSYPVELDVEFTHFGESDEAWSYEVDEMEVTGNRGRKRDTTVYLELEDGEDFGASDNAIRSALEDVGDAFDFSLIDTGERVAQATFSSEDEYTVELLNVQPNTNHAITTSDGYRIRSLTRDDNEYIYTSAPDETPAEGRVAFRAVEDPQGSTFGFYLDMIDNDDVEARASVTGLPSISQAYGAMVEWIRNHTLEDAVETAGGEVTVSDREVRDQLSELADTYVDYNMEERPGSGVDEGEFYAALVGKLNVLPDASHRADISVRTPTEQRPTYKVDWTVSIMPSRLGGLVDSQHLGDNDIGETDDKADVPGMVEEAIRTLSGYSPYLARRDNEDVPPQNARNLPGFRENDIRSYVDASLPVPKEELASEIAADADGPPVELEEVSQVGPSRAEVLEEDGVFDVIDVAVLLSSTKTSFLSTTLVNLPETPRESIQEAAAKVWARYIWPKRELPDGYDRIGSGDAEPPETDSDPVLEEDTSPEPPDIDDLPSAFGDWEATTMDDASPVYAREFEINGVEVQSQVSVQPANDGETWEVIHSIATFGDDGSEVNSFTVDTGYESVEMAVPFLATYLGDEALEDIAEKMPSVEAPPDDEDEEEAAMEPDSDPDPSETPEQPPEPSDGGGDGGDNVFPIEAEVTLVLDDGEAVVDVEASNLDAVDEETLGDFFDLMEIVADPTFRDPPDFIARAVFESPMEYDFVEYNEATEGLDPEDFDPPGGFETTTDEGVTKPDMEPLETWRAPGGEQVEIYRTTVYINPPLSDFTVEADIPPETAQEVVRNIEGYTLLNEREEQEPSQPQDQDSQEPPEPSRSEGTDESETEERPTPKADEPDVTVSEREDEKSVRGVPVSTIPDVLEPVLPGVEVEVDVTGNVVELRENVVPDAQDLFDGEPAVVTAQTGEGSDLFEQAVVAYNAAVDTDPLDVEAVNDARRNADLDIPLLDESPAVSESEEPEPEPVGGEDLPVTDQDRVELQELAEVLNNEQIPGETRAEEASETVDSILQSAYPNTIEDSRVDLDFGRGGGLRALVLTAQLTSQKRDDIAGRSIWADPGPQGGTVVQFRILGDPNNPVSLIQSFEKVMDGLDETRPGNQRLKDKLDHIEDFTTFKFVRGNVDLDKSFISAPEMRALLPELAEEIQRSFDAHLQNIDAAYYAAQKVHEVDTGGDIRGRLEQSVGDFPSPGSRAEMLEKALGALDSGDFEPGVFFRRYYDSIARDTPSDIWEERGIVTDDDEEEESEPEPEPESEPEPDSTEREPGPEPESEPSPGGEEPTQQGVEEKDTSFSEMSEVVTDLSAVEEELEEVVGNTRLGDIGDPTVADEAREALTEVQEIKGVLSEKSLGEVQPSDITQARFAVDIGQAAVENMETAAEESADPGPEPQPEPTPEPQPEPTSEPQPEPVGEFNTFEQAVEERGPIQVEVFALERGFGNVFGLRLPDQPELTQKEGEGVADQVAQELFSEVDPDEYAPGEAIGTAVVSPDRVESIEVGGVTDDQPAQPATDPEPQSGGSAAEQMGRMDTGDVEIDELTIEDLDIEEVRVGDVTAENVNTKDVRDIRSDIEEDI